MEIISKHRGNMGKPPRGRTQPRAGDPRRPPKVNRGDNVRNPTDPRNFIGVGNDADATDIMMETAWLDNNLGTNANDEF